MHIHIRGARAGTRELKERRINWSGTGNVGSTSVFRGPISMVSGGRSSPPQEAFHESWEEYPHHVPEIEVPEHSCRAGIGAWQESQVQQLYDGV